MSLAVLSPCCRAVLVAVLRASLVGKEEATPPFARAHDMMMVCKNRRFGSYLGRVYLAL
jgi:hypothetical protein